MRFNLEALEGNTPEFKSLSKTKQLRRLLVLKEELANQIENLPNNTIDAQSAITIGKLLEKYLTGIIYDPNFKQPDITK